MTETYTSLGFATTSSFGVPFVASMLSVAFFVRKGNAGKFPWFQVGVALWAVLSLLLGLPVFWFMGMIVIASGVAICRSAKGKQAGLVTGTILVVVGILPLTLPLWSGANHFVLRENDATSKFGTVPRSKLHAERSSFDWRLETAPGPGFNLGPIADKMEVYWGPHGLMSAQAVGERLFQWVGSDNIARR